MKASARIMTGSIATGRASLTGAVGGAGWLVGRMKGEAHTTDDVSIIKYLRVKPEQPQGLVWLVPQYGIDYTIESNTNWNIK